MGYTHYWTQTRAFTDEEWSELATDIGEIISYVENITGVPLAVGFLAVHDNHRQRRSDPMAQRHVTADRQRHRAGDSRR